MTNIIDIGIECGRKVELGPQSTGHAVIVDGRHIPNLRAHDRGKEIEFILDNRFGYSVPAELSALFAEAMGQAMAIGAGFASIHSEGPRTFAAKICKIGE